MSHSMKTTLQCTICLSLLFLSACGEKDEGAALEGKLKGQNLLLVTLDTTRADRIGAYGYKPAKQPTLDALAANGTLFEQTYAQIPLTLPSHSSMMTGRYPREHGVRDNGRNALGKTHPTLAEFFKKDGYATGAFVASFVLDSRFGIDRGFDVFEDDMDQVSLQTQPMEWQQPASVITDRAMQWLPTVKDKPFFAWVHFYDAHHPYQPPKEYFEAGLLPYDGELAHIDSQLKRIIDWVDQSGLREKTLIVVVGDHGEAFEEHQELGHSNFVYNENIHVPFIWSHPTVIPKSRRIPALVEVLDVFPTVMQLYGFPRPEALMSRSLVRAFLDGKIEDRPAYAESLFVYYSFAWAEQRTLITPEWKYVSSTKPELFHRKKDPHEKENLIDKEPRVAEKLRKQLHAYWESMPEGKGDDADLDPETRQALSTLGYSDTGAKSGPEQFVTDGLPDPKDHHQTLAHLKGAKSLMEHAKSPDEVKLAVPLFRHIVRLSPGSQMFHMMLGMALVKAKEPEMALEAFKEGMKLDSENSQALGFIADTYLQLKKLPEALQHFELALAMDDKTADTFFRHAETLMMMDRTDDAIASYRKALAIFPDFAPVHARLAQALKAANKMDEAAPHFATSEKLLKESLAKKPDDFESMFRLGSIYLSTDRFSQAAEQFRAVIAKNPKHAHSMMSLATALEESGDNAGAEEWIRKAAAFDEVAAESAHALGALLNKQGRTADAIASYERTIALQPSRQRAIQELSGYYMQNRRMADAVRILRIGAEHTTNPVFPNMTAKILSTSTDDKIRDGKAAVQYATKANEMTKDSDPSVLATLAAAHAEVGDFDKAIEIAIRAIDLANAGNKPELAAAIAEQVESYKQKKPIRDPRF